MPFQSVRIATKDRQVDFWLDLDRQDANERFLLEYLDAGVCYEPDVTQIMLRTIKPGDFVLDIGANIGFFTVLMAKLVGPTGRVWAFECNPAVENKLRNNLDKNQLLNVQVFNRPLWCRDEPVEFWANLDSSGGSALWDPGLCDENRLSREHPVKFNMQGVTLDSLMKTQENAPSLIKIDIEGAEPAVMRGAQTLLERTDYPTMIISELNPFGMKQMGETTESYRDFMFDRGYELFLPNPNGILPAMVPRNSVVAYQNGMVIQNGLFSTVTAVGQAWPKVPCAFD